MKRRLPWLGVIGLLLFFIPFSQGQETLDQFFSSDHLPVELNEKSADRLEALFSHYSTENDVSRTFTKKEYESFVYKSNYFIEKLNRSGSIFYGDTISDYLNSLKDFLLEGHPKKDEIQIYLTRFPSFNAFANDFGKVYVNVSVLARAKNEEELLAILSHEISHVLLQHTHKFEEFNKVIQNDRLKSNAAFEILAQHGFSRIQEAEADLLGFRMLRDRNIDLNKASKILRQLEFELDPNIPGPWKIDLLSGGDESLEKFLRIADIGVDGKYLEIKLDSADSLGTHPSIGKRQAMLEQFIADSTDTTIQLFASSNQGDFSYFKRLSNRLLIQTYIVSGWYFEGLDEVLKLREQNPGDEELVIAQAKLLTLICQNRYSVTPFSQFLNDKGNSYSDTTFMRNKEMFLSFNSLEMNILALHSVRALQEKHPHPYLDRVYDYLMRFLYQNNELLFAKKDGILGFLPEETMNDSTVTVNELNLAFSLNKPDREHWEELQEEDGLVYVPIAGVNRGMPMLKHYFRIYPLSDVDRDNFERYKATRDNFERTLTFDKFNISLLPTKAVKNFYRGEFDRSESFDKNVKMALVQSTNLFLRNKGGRLYVDYKKSLELEKRMIELMDTLVAFKTNYSNLNVSQLSVRSNNKHYNFNLWISERFQLENLVYSKVDEQIQELKKEEGLKYLIYNINVVSKGKIPGVGRHSAYSYMIYFDLENAGVAYASKISSRQRPNDQLLKQLLYLWKKNI